MQSQASEVPLRGRVALVTGVSRRAGIGWAVAEHLGALGATVVATGWRAHDAEMAWGAANVRSIVLLARRFAERHDPARPGGRMLWFTSGQHLAPMGDEIAYAATKGALHQLARSLGDALIDRGIVANCINPGPVDTGWASAEVHDAVAAMFPSGRWTTPAEVAALVGLLVRDEAAGVQGQVVDAEHGFRRWSPAR